MMLSAQEVERRLRRVSQLRTLILEARKTARQAWREGRFPYEPAHDIRSDVEYWQKLAEEKDAG